MPKIVFRYQSGEHRQIDIPAGDTVMRGALNHGLAGIVAECGGVLTCATCHVHVAQSWLEFLAPPSLAETELLEMIEDLSANSRLTCQIIMSEALDGLVVDIPPSNF